MEENHDIHWQLLKQEHNDWTHEDLALLAIVNSLDEAKRMQKALLDDYAENICIDDDDEALVDYGHGIVTFKTDDTGEYFYKIIIKEFKNNSDLR